MRPFKIWIGPLFAMAALAVVSLAQDYPGVPIRRNVLSRTGDTATGLMTFNAGLTVTGAAVNLNASSNFATNINTGTSTGALSLGGGSGTVAINGSGGLVVSTTGAVSGVSTLAASGQVTLSTSTSPAINVTGAPSIGLGIPLSTFICLTGTDCTGTVGRSVRSVASVLRISNDSNFIDLGPNLDLNSVGGLINSSATNGGDVGFNDNIRGNVAATGSTWTLGSSITAAAATTTVPAIRVLPINALDATDLVFQVATSAGGNLLSVDNSGLTVIASGLTAAGAFSGITTLNMTGLLTGTGGATVTGAAVNLNASSNFAVNIGTGTSTGAVGIGNSANAVTIAGIISGASPLVFDGATVDALNRTTLAVTDPTAARTITLPDATITVNAAANISGTTLASNVVTSSLTSVGNLTSLTIGASGTSIAGSFAVTATIDVASIAANTCLDTSQALTNAAAGAPCVLGAPAAATANVQFSCYASAAGTVQLRSCNVTTSAIDPASASYQFRIFNP